MTNSKLIRLLRTLDKKELKRFGDYLSGLYSMHTAALKVFEHIRPFHPGYDSQELHKAHILREILGLPGAPEKRVSNEGSKLYKWLLDFLVWEKLRSPAHEFERNKLLLELFKERKLEADFSRQAQRARAASLNQPESTRLPLQLMEIAHEQYYHTTAQKLKPENPLIAEAVGQLENFYQLNRLKYRCELLSRALALQEKPDFSSNCRVGEGPFALLRLYVLCLELLEKGGVQRFVKLRDGLFPEADKISREDEHVLLSYLVNFAARQLLKGEKDWHQRAFGLYQYAIQREILLTDGYISNQAFHNIIQLACELKQFSWAVQFTLEYEPYLHPGSRLSTIRLAQARIEFGQGHFRQACALLRELKFEDPSFALLAKLLEVRSHYELEEGYNELLELAINAFENYLRRDGVVNKDSTLQGYKNFLKTIRMMARKASRQEVAEAVKQYDYLVCRAWLERKLQSLPE